MANNRRDVSTMGKGLFTTAIGLLVCLQSIALVVGGCTGEEPPGIAPPPGVFDPISLAAHPSGRFVLVANGNFFLSYRAGSVVVIDTLTNRVIPESKIEVGSYAGRMIINPEGDTAYLAVREDGTITWIALHEEDGSLRLDCGQPTGNIPRCSSDHQFVLRDEQGGRALEEPFDLAFAPIPSYAPDDPFDTAQDEQVQIQQPHRTIWATYLRPGGVAIIPLDEQGVPFQPENPDHLIFTRRLLTSLSVFPDGSGGFGSTIDSMRVSVLDLLPTPLNEGKLELSSPISLNLAPQFEGYQEVRALALSPEGGRLYSTGPTLMRTANVPAYLLVHQVVYLPDGLPDLVLIAEIPLRAIPNAIAISPAAPDRPSKVYVLGFESNIIQVVDPNTLRLEDTIRVGEGPFDMTFAETPLGLRGYVANFRANSVSVVDLEPGETFHQQIEEIKGLD